MPELKNCPFCGSDRVRLMEKKSRGAEGCDKFTYYVKCQKCHARGPSCGGTVAKNRATWRGFALYNWNKALRITDLTKGER